MHHSPLLPRTSNPGALTIRPLRGCTGFALTGEADWTVKDMLRAMLAALPAGDVGGVHLDLSGLRFIDLSCTRELLAITSRRGTRLIAHQPPHSLRRIIAIVRPQAAIEFTGKPVTEVAHARTRGSGTAPPLAWILP